MNGPIKGDATVIGKTYLIEHEADGWVIVKRDADGYWAIDFNHPRYVSYDKLIGDIYEIDEVPVASQEPCWKNYCGSIS